jgi:hypothetical protein
MKTPDRGEARLRVMLTKTKPLGDVVRNCWRCGGEFRIVEQERVCVKPAASPDLRILNGCTGISRFVKNRSWIW